eukprot:XP_011434393.1 PREDICTED: uncharacterized protein LOC105333226 isoform X2 [Crassostrea gigas]
MVWFAILILMLSILVISFSDYEFEVFPVKVCPRNTEESINASLRLNCNTTHGYHCVPNKNFTSLIEFCYPRGEKIPFHKGNCLELADVGILNHVKCDKTFLCGCPDEFYFSNELYKYPLCTNINPKFGCFSADMECIVSRFMENMTKIQNYSNYIIEKNNKKEYKYSNNSNSSIDTDNRKDNAFVLDCTVDRVVSVTVTLALSVFIIMIIFLLRWIWDRKNDHKSLPCRPIVKYSPAPSEDPQVKTLSSESDSNIDGNIPLTRTRSSRHSELNPISAIRRRIMEGKQQSSVETARKQLGRRGFNPLHIAAKEGNLDAFKTTYEACNDISSTTTDGRNILHIASYYGNHDICEYILTERKELYEKTDNNQIYPAHWAALAGHVNILELMSNHGCDLAYKTRKYEENIVLFACMNTGLDVFKFVAKNENLATLLHAKNRENWNSIQYAAKNGNLEAVKFLYENGVDIKNKSHKTGKNCLHTACEKGFNDVCAYILQKCPDLIQEKDKNNKHVGHFVAKSGNTNILKELLKYRDKSLWKKATSDNVNVLHIACKYARLDMCIEFEKLDILHDLVLELTEKGWNAALFLTERAENELKRIEILKLLDKHGLDVHHASRAGKTILYNACANQSTKLIEYLLQNYPDLLCLERSIDAKTATDSTEIKSLLDEYRQKIVRHQ